MTAAPSLPRRLRSTLGRIAREAVLYPAALRPRRGRPRLAVLPSQARVQSGLLRGYNMADELRLHGWQAIVLPPHLTQAQRQRLLALFRPDLLLVQQCRHPLNRVQHLEGWRLVLDIDDADFLDPALQDELEAMARRAAGVVCGSRYIRDWALPFTANARVIWTGTPVSTATTPRHGERRPIVTWAQSSPLGYVAEFAFVRDVMCRTAARIGPVQFRLYGWDAPPDHPYLDEMHAAGVTVELLPFLEYPAFLASLREVAVGLSPIVPEGFSRGKSFGKILGYLDADVPVICSDEADHALFFTAESGIVSNDPEIWVDAICSLLADPGRRDAMAAAARRAFAAQLSTGAAGAQLHQFLSPLVSGRNTGPPLAAADQGV